MKGISSSLCQICALWLVATPDLVRAPGPDLSCEVEVEKTCSVIAPPSSLQCEDKIVATTLRYIGPTIHGADVEVEADKDGVMVATYSGNLESGETILTNHNQNGFTIDARPDENELGSKMFIRINGIEEKIHTSCSTPYVAGQPAPLDNPKGDPSPNWEVVNFLDKDGIFAEIPGPAEFSDSCEIISGNGVLCTKRPMEIMFRYTGEDCSATSNNQDPGKVLCQGDPGLAQSVRVTVSKPNEDLELEKVYLDTVGVNIGDVVTATAANADRNDFESSVMVLIWDEGGNLLQGILFHSSCSQDLRIGDIFGGVQIVGFTNEEQGVVQSGANVEYQYKITNSGNAEASSISVEDDVLGIVPGSPLAMLSPGNSVTLTNTAHVDTTTTNKVIVEGVAANGFTCSAEDSVTTTVLPRPISCADGKPVSLTFLYTGEDCSATTNNQEGKAECTGTIVSDPIDVVVTKDADKFVVTPGTPISLGQVFTIEMAEEGKTFPSKIKLQLSGPGEQQQLKIHTSCSKDLTEGDQFGALLLEAFSPEEN